MTLEDALDIVLKQAEAYHGNILPDWAESESDDSKFLRMDRDNSVEALEMVEDAVLKYMKIEKWIGEKDKLNGKASIVIEDGNVRAES